MAGIIEMMEYLKKYPVFEDRTIANKLNKKKSYINLYLYRLNKRNLIRRIEKNKYTVLDDPLIVASRIIWPSYISCWSALNYHHLTEQVPQDICVVATKNKKEISVAGTTIRFVKIKPANFFGYDKIKYSNYEIFIADMEKSIIDSALLKKVSFSELKGIFLENINNINIKKFIYYLKKINNRSLTKRFGYLFELAGKDYYKYLKKYIDATYIKLDWSKSLAGKKNIKWRILL